MAKKKAYKVYVNHDDIKQNLENMGLKFLEDPAQIGKDTLAVVARFLAEEEKDTYKDVFPLLEGMADKDVPVIVLDEKIIPENSKRAWLYRNTVRYLPLDDPETTWNEIRSYLSERRDDLERASQIIKTDQVYRLGYSVEISPKDFQQYNLVSLFVGVMGQFMVSLKLRLDSIRPEELYDNPLKKDFDIVQALEFERAIRNKNQEHVYKDRSYSYRDMQELLEKSGWRDLFDRKRPSVSQNHILLEGETGTGKSIIASFIHEYVYQGFHNEIRGDLKRVTCANIGKGIMESYLFGSMKGAFTDAITRPGAILEAYNGTLFLDEIGEMGPELQARFLSYLDTQYIEPEGWSGQPIYVPSLVVAATNRDLEEEVRKGRFRRDLYHRLGFKIRIPPMRDRIGDLDRLIDFVLQNPAINPNRGRAGRAIKMIEKKAVELLRGYSFPGNFRELEQILRRAVIKARISGLSIITTEHVRSSLEGQ